MPLSHLNALVKSSYRSRLDHHSKDIGQIHHLFLKHLMYMCSLVRTQKNHKANHEPTGVQSDCPTIPVPICHISRCRRILHGEKVTFSAEEMPIFDFFDSTSENGGISNQNDDNLK